MQIQSFYFCCVAIAFTHESKVLIKEKKKSTKKKKEISIQVHLARCLTKKKRDRRCMYMCVQSKTIIFVCLFESKMEMIIIITLHLLFFWMFFFSSRIGESRHHCCQQFFKHSILEAFSTHLTHIPMHNVRTTTHHIQPWNKL